MNTINRETLIKQIKDQAKLDVRKRRDRRFLETMGFLVAKGFLKTNMRVPFLPSQKLRIKDAVWAGLNVEPRILEVLPAAVLRLEKHFDLDPIEHRELAQVVEQLRKRDEKGEDFCGVPFEKLRVWAELPLRDKRVKAVTEKKVIKTFRLDPLAIERLRKIAKEKGVCETQALESLILGAKLSIII